jgi:hypothetical protein
MASLQPGQAAEVGQALAFLLGHVIAVGQVRRADRGEPLVGADLMAGDFGDRVPDLVVVVDRIEGLFLYPRCPARMPSSYPWTLSCPMGSVGISIASSGTSSAAM